MDTFRSRNPLYDSLRFANFAQRAPNPKGSGRRIETLGPPTKDPTFLRTNRGRCINAGFANQESHATALHGVRIDLFDGFAEVYILFAFAEALQLCSYQRLIGFQGLLSVRHKLYRIPMWRGDTATGSKGVLWQGQYWFEGLRRASVWWPKNAEEYSPI